MFNPAVLTEVMLPGRRLTAVVKPLDEPDPRPVPSCAPRTIVPSGARRMPPWLMTPAYRVRPPNADSGGAGSSPAIPLMVIDPSR